MNTTPDENGNSPASTLFHRLPRTNLISIKVKGDASYTPKSKADEKKYDVRSKDLPEIEPDTSVRIFDRNKRTGNWNKRGKVIAKRNEPRSYDVLNEKGNVIRRNRQHLIPTKESFESDQLNDSDDEIELYERSETTTDLDVPNENEIVEDNGYVTRSGRLSRKPERYGY